MVAASDPRIEEIREGETILALLAAHAPDGLGEKVSRSLDSDKASGEILVAYTLGAVAGIQFAVGRSLMNDDPRANYPGRFIRTVIAKGRNFCKKWGL